MASWRKRRSRAHLPVLDARVVAATLETGRRGYRPCWDVEYEQGGASRRARCHEADDRFVTGTTRSRDSIVRAAAQRRLNRHVVGDVIQIRIPHDQGARVVLAREELDLQPLYLVLGMLGVVAAALGVLYLFF